uniref:Sigma-70 family RNA polymerase sigma factor n=1 Tax=Roseihalotalea indica TaxID=2867963 RepID=A0AA49JEW1_9BACT|nr:sigma-70 family RNA polymerase sigma factor [Tunicatimonas sp. TK19036]
MSEEQLIRGLRNKDKQAFTYLYDHYSPAIFGVISRIVTEPKVAEEVLQDVFLKFWNKIDHYDESKGALFTWMLTLTRNTSRDRLRSKEYKSTHKTDSISDYVHKVEGTHAVNPDVSDIGLRNTLGQLNEEQQFVVEMLYFRGYSQSELSKEFDIPLGTVKTRVRSAMLKLRKLLRV